VYIYTTEAIYPVNLDPISCIKALSSEFDESKKKTLKATLVTMLCGPLKILLANVVHSKKSVNDKFEMDMKKEE